MTKRQRAPWSAAEREAHLARLLERNRAQHKGDFLYENSDWMREAYQVRGLTLRQVAAEAACGVRTIVRWMETHGIPTDRSRGNHKKGSESYQWKGGKPPCPVCGGPKSRPSTTCMGCQDKAGSNNPQWLPDEAVTYDAMHRRVAAARGRPDTHACQHCSSSAEEWAYDHTDPNERPSAPRSDGRINGPFSLDVAKYMPLCVPCHRRFDKGLAKARRVASVIRRTLPPGGRQ